MWLTLIPWTHSLVHQTPSCCVYVCSWVLALIREGFKLLGLRGIHVPMKITLPISIIWIVFEYLWHLLCPVMLRFDQRQSNDTDLVTDAKIWNIWNMPWALLLSQLVNEPLRSQLLFIINFTIFELYFLSVISLPENCISLTLCHTLTRHQYHDQICMTGVLVDHVSGKLVSVVGYSVPKR